MQCVLPGSSPTLSCRQAGRAAVSVQPSTSVSAQQRLPDSSRSCRVFNARHQLIPYQQAWSWQKQLVAQVQQGVCPDTLLLLQHPPVYTLGAGSTEDNLRFDPDDPPVPLYRTERGGEVTYHGPGQLVVYPILNLSQHRRDLHWYLRQLEEVVIRALDSVSGLEGTRIDGLTGVWVEGQKVAAIGVRASRWVTYHGLALNVVPDMRPFELIVPCGIADRRVTSVAALLQAQHHADASYEDQQQQQQLMAEYQFALLQLFAEVFDVELVDADMQELA